MIPIMRQELKLRDLDLISYGFHVIVCRSGIKWLIATQQDECDNAEGPKIDGLAVVVSFDDLCGHVTHRAHLAAQLALVPVLDGQAKVHQQDVAAGVCSSEHQVLRLNVSMHDVMIVTVLQGAQHSATYRLCVSFRILLSLRHSGEQVSASCQLDAQIEAVLFLKEVQKLDDVFVIQLLEEVHFVDNGIGEFWGRVDPCLQDSLHRDFRVRAHLHSHEDGAKAPATQLSVRIQHITVREAQSWLRG
jgi:hypothetical protein